MSDLNKISSQFLFDSLVTEGISTLKTDTDISIVEFAEQIVFNGENQLYPTQRALLKAFYKEPLNDDELLILESWKDNDRTTWVDSRKYRNLVFEGGRRSSKSTLISIIILYEFYKLILKESPASYYGLLPNSPIALFVISQSQEQVKETLFAAIRGYAEGSYFFKSLEQNKKIEILTEEIRCPSKNVGIYAKHTKSKSLVGYSIKALVLDEAARFEYDEFGNSKADELWENVGRAVQTFGNEGLKIAISSAWEVGDYIEKLYELAHRDAKTLGFKLRTWDLNLNPNLSEESLKSSEDYIKEPIRAATEYEGIRVLKQGTFFVPTNVKQCFKGSSVIDANQTPIQIVNSEGDIRYYTGVEISRIEYLQSSVSFAHVDYGLKKDSAALAICRPVSIEDKWRIAVEAILVWKPFIDKDKNNKGIQRIVSFLNLEEILLQVCKARRVQICSFDSFQSGHAIQNLHKHGINTVEMGTSNEKQLLYYTTTKNLIDQELLILPKDSQWSTTAEFELLNIIQLPNGRVDHPKNGGSKDIADAITNSVYNCYMNMVTSGVYNSFFSGISSVNNSKSLHLSNKRIDRRENVNKLNRIKSSNLI